jgi:hypothetical protein
MEKGKPGTRSASEKATDRDHRRGNLPVIAFRPKDNWDEEHNLIVGVSF